MSQFHKHLLEVEVFSHCLSDPFPVLTPDEQDSALRDAL